jgi:hypothetical protein
MEHHGVFLTDNILDAPQQDAAAHLPSEDHADRHRATDLASNPGAGYDAPLLPSHRTSGRVGVDRQPPSPIREDGKEWGVPEYDELGEFDLLDESKTQLSKVLRAEGDSLIYVYDYGDNWRHGVLLEEIIPVSDVVKSPICFGGERRCPPEDVGGVSGYEQFLDVIFDPGHEDFEHFRDWAGASFQPEEFDVQAVNLELSRLRWPIRHRR